MNLNQAKLAGLKAFEAGQGRAPALNQAFTKQAMNQAETKLVDLLGAYLHGWDIGNLAEAAPAGAPSIAARAAILEAAGSINPNEQST